MNSPACAAPAASPAWPALAVAGGLRSPNLPLLMALALRPIDRAERPPELAALAALDGAEQITLSALGPTETVALAAACLGLPAQELPAAVAGLVRSRV